MNRQLSVFIIILLITSGYSMTAAEVLFSGNSRSMINFRESYLGNGDDGTVDNARFYETVRAKLVGRGESSSFGFHTFLQSSTDFSEDYSTDPIWKLYNAYFQYKNNHADFTLGRQWLHLGPGSLTLDGVKVTLKSGTTCDFTGYIGMESPYSRSFDTGGWDKSQSGGLYFSTRRISKLNLGVGYTQKNYLGETALQEVGLYAKTRLSGPLQFNGRLDFDLKGDQVQKAVLGARYDKKKDYSIMAEYRHYLPRIYYKSYFKKFYYQANDQVRTGISYYLSDWTTVSANYTAIFFDDENNGYLSIDLSCPYGSITYYQGMGFGGDEIGVAVGATYPVCEQLDIYADLDFSKYRFYEHESETDRLFTSMFGFDWKPTRDILTGVEFQNVDNEILNKDWRMLLKFSINGSGVF